ncbi:MAG: hypothetical protein C4541_01480 [Candidatus Auribacter fodinae]|jgi:prepilin-type processing-associated H-X9-DG protein|uniref:DUF1559 domain-containing protein n=1 Tax=Candidatus Auribacter fodinae TaxID=2093366 RepID=A0A3A4RIX8_9BACT|nr:MAG: hypothetical protein C4541_01480 [Candidatus Auribacter fodinae]
MIVTIKEYLAIAMIIIFLVVLSGTRVRIGTDKFHQLICAGHLKRIYQNMIEEIEQNPALFDEHPESPWYELLKVDQHYLVCPSADKTVQPEKGKTYTHYALNKSAYDHIKDKHSLPDAAHRKVLIVDGIHDPAGFDLFPMANPAFRHNGGCNILLTDGSVIWLSKDNFSAGNIGFSIRTAEK